MVIRFRAAFLAALLGVFLTAGHAQDRPTLSIGTGFTSGVYYPMGKGLANLINKHVPGYAARVEGTGGSVDNLKLLATKHLDLGFSMADATWDAYSGSGKFKGGKLAVRALLVLYPNSLHVVTLERPDIAGIADLRGRPLATGAPGSATEIMALRLLEAYGIHDDFKRERLSLEDSVAALKERKVDALFWSGGVPTRAIDALAAGGVKIRLVDHDDAVDGMVKKYGPLYARQVIPAHAYTGVSRPTRVAGVWNILVVSEAMPEALAYRLARAIFDHRSELLAAHKEAGHLSLQNQKSANSPIPFHPGAIKYFAERQIRVQ